MLHFCTFNKFNGVLGYLDMLYSGLCRFFVSFIEVLYVAHVFLLVVAPVFTFMYNRGK